MTEKKYKLTEVRIRMVEGLSLYSPNEMNSPSSAAAIMRHELSQYDREVLCIVNLNTHLQPINFNIVAIGSADFAIFNVSDILKSTILSNATGFMLFHNHPSGRLDPSDEDINMTNRMVKVADLLSLEFVDHIIVGGGNDNYYSFKENGVVDFEVSNTKIIGEKNKSMEARKLLRRNED